jgi:hypothetical protein
MSKENTTLDVAKALRGFYESNIQALQGVLEKLPEGLRGDLQRLKDGLNAQLEKLGPIDQVPLAQEAAWALNSFADTVARMQEYTSSLTERLMGLSKDIASKATALQGWDDRVKAGELLTKDAAKALCDTAREDGAKSRLPDIVAMRKHACELAGLPEPGEAILGLPAADFDARLTGAKDQVGKLAAKGLTLAGKGKAFVQELAWAPAAEFAGRLTALEDVLGSKPGAPAGDPLLGAPAGQKTEPKKVRAVV